MNNTRILLNLALPLLFKSYAAKGWELLPQEDGMALCDMIRITCSTVVLEFKKNGQRACVHLELANASRDISDIVIDYDQVGFSAMSLFETELKKLEG